MTLTGHLQFLPLVFLAASSMAHTQCHVLYPAGGLGRAAMATNSQGDPGSESPGYRETTEGEPGSTDAGEPSGGALDGDRPRVIVSTDIGGSDPDDFQSMAHLLVYADVLDLEGLVSSSPQQGRAEHIHEVIDAYERDYRKLVSHSKMYPTPDALRAMTTQGAFDPAPRNGWSESTEGSRWIVARAKVADKRPLWILVWGSITDVAQAVHDDPSIKNRIRVYSIGSWNTKMDPAAREYLFNNHPDLWWIESDTTFRGMYMGGDESGDLGNVAFVRQHVKGHGALGDLFFAKKRDIKMGDTPSLLYLLRGEMNDPASPHWGGAYVRTDHGSNYWTDNPSPKLTEGDRPGARTVNRWRKDFLDNWRQRMDRLQRYEVRP
jgi:Cellulose-binding Sde182, nucleoside hydrolase-like domain